MKFFGEEADSQDNTKLDPDCVKLQALQNEKGGTNDSAKGHPSKYSFGTIGRTFRQSERAVDYKTIPGKMKLDYMHGMRDQTQKSLEGIQNLLAHFRKPQLDIDSLLKDAANMIWRQLGIDSVSIGLRDPKDKLYKYKVMVGFRDDVVEAHKKISYTKEQFFDSPDYVGSDISDLSRIYMVEDNNPSEDDKKTFNRPGLLSAMKRRTSTDSLEGDYIDVRIYGANDDLLGWIEISGTRTMKLPSATTIRWVETIASIIGAALRCVDTRKL